MAIVLRVEVASQVDERAQPNTVPQRAAMASPNPLQNRLAADESVLPCAGKANEVAMDPFLILQLESSHPTSGEIGIDRCVQHDTVSGQGCAVWCSSSRSTLA